MSTKKSFFWWLKTIGQGLATTAVAFAPEILQAFPEHTLIFKLALPIGFFIKYTFAKKEYQKDILPSGLSDKVFDKLPNGLTGIRGSKK